MIPTPIRFAVPILLTSLAACAPPQQAPRASLPPVTTTSAPIPPSHHVYRLDFVLTATEKNGPPSSTTFTLNLEEHEKGEVHAGENASRQEATIAAQFRNVGDDLLIEVAVETSAFYPPSNVQKVKARSNALASPGKSAVVTVLDDRERRYQLTVTPTKLR